MTSGNPFKAGAAKYLRSGWSPIAMPERDKFPPPKGWTGYLGERLRLSADGTSFKAPKSWMTKAHNIAIRVPESVIGIDVDNYGKKHGGTTFTDWQVEHGALPPTWRSTSRISDSVSGIRFFRVPAGLRWAGVLDGGDVEVVNWHHRYAMVSPSIHPDSTDEDVRVYRWYCPHGVLATDCLIDCPRMPTVDDLPLLPDAWVAALGEGKASIPTKVDLKDSDVGEWLEGLVGDEPCPRVTEALEHYVESLSDGGSRHDTGRDGLRRLVALGEEGHFGVPAAIDALETAWTDALAGDRDGSAEWVRMLVGAVALALGDPTPEADRGCCGSDAAAVFGEDGQPAPLVIPSSVLAEPRSGGMRVGDTFNEDDSMVTLTDLLEKHGWTVTDEEVRCPGRGENDGPVGTISNRKLKLGQSADARMAPFKKRKAYTKFQVYAMLEHGGDFKAAAKALRQQGWVIESDDWLRLHHPDLVDVNCETLLNLYTRGDGCWSLRSRGKKHRVFLEYVGNRYVQRGDAQQEAILQRRLKKAVYFSEEAGWTPFPVTPSRLDTYRRMVSTMVHIDEAVDLDMWDICNDEACANIDTTQRYRSMRNGLLNVDTGELIPHNPAFITLNNIPFDWDKDAGDPLLTMQTVREQFPEDHGAVLPIFQEYMGFLVFGSNTDRLAAVIAFLGQSGAGKSMWSRVAESLVGPTNVNVVSPAMLGTNFGKQGCIGKRLNIMPDADAKFDSQASTFLKGASDGDTMGFDVKNQDPHSGPIPGPFALISNSIPTFTDSTGVTADRIYELWFTVKFRGTSGDKRDLAADIVDQEAPELLAWLWKGYRRVLERGRFLRVETGITAEIHAQIGANSSPFKAWVNEKVEEVPGGRLDATEARDRCNSWVTFNGLGDEMSQHAFGNEMREVFPNVKAKQYGSGEKRGQRYYAGLRFKPTQEENAEDSAEDSGAGDMK